MLFNSEILAPTRPETADNLAAMNGCGCACKGTPGHIELSLDSDVLDALHEMGEDWEAHFNAILREWLHSHSPAM